MDLTIEQSCPSCGASIVLLEDDRLIRCAYCDVNNYRLESAASRYLLPSKQPDHISPTQLFFTPYLRFKGTIFYVREGEVGHKIVDTTRLGIEEEKLPSSLGLRPQAMKLLPVVASTEGTFFQQSLPTKSAFAHAAMVSELFSDKSDKVFYHRAFIGETLSRIYQPCYLHEGIVYDAVVNRPIGAGKFLDRHRDKTCSAKLSWEPQFISTICPNCSGLLSGERDSLVLRCRNCDSLWQENGKRFQSVVRQVVDSEERSAQYLPFWRITFSTHGWILKSYGDYLRFTNQPVVVDRRFDSTPLAFWIPAFKLNPKAFLQVSAQLTVSQWRIPSGKSRWVSNAHPVTLSQKEAVQAIKSVLAVTTLNKSNRLPLLPKMTIADVQCQLIYLPFIKQPHDYVQEHTAATLLAAALLFGRKL
jgi:DNA-directed RNA polymerase subunit RPC12/RpoP